VTSTAKKFDKVYTYADYLGWPHNERWEILGGVAYGMSPAPDRRHQEISGALHNAFYSFLKGRTCRVYAAPFDVRLPESGTSDDSITTVVQPDLVVVCDPAKLDKRGALCPPDLVVEIVSPTSAARDMKEKVHLYEKHGITEYWIVHPEEAIVMVYRHVDGAYGRPDVFAGDDTIEVGVLPGLTIAINEIFPQSQSE